MLSGTFRAEAESSAEERSVEGGVYLASGPVWLHLHLQLRASLEHLKRRLQLATRDHTVAEGVHQIPPPSPDLALYSSSGLRVVWPGFPELSDHSKNIYSNSL